MALSLAFVIVHAVNIDDPFIVLARVALDLNNSRVSPSLNVRLTNSAEHDLFLLRSVVLVCFAFEHLGGGRVVENARVTQNLRWRPMVI